MRPRAALGESTSRVPGRAGTHRYVLGRSLVEWGASLRHTLEEEQQAAVAISEREEAALARRIEASVSELDTELDKAMKQHHRNPSKQPKPVLWWEQEKRAVHLGRLDTMEVAKVQFKLRLCQRLQLGPFNQRTGASGAANGAAANGAAAKRSRPRDADVATTSGSSSANSGEPASKKIRTEGDAPPPASEPDLMSVDARAPTRTEPRQPQPPPAPPQEPLLAQAGQWWTRDEDAVETSPTWPWAQPLPADQAAAAPPAFRPVIRHRDVVTYLEQQRTQPYASPNVLQRGYTQLDQPARY